ncbi:nickel-responsive transcriptional regulator NikR [Pelomicrobium sp. G1]|uniref:nickel-responsive transcriptional regulator NikR n=1 Tax=unclassified Pelomicrobium TaxID=2815318 RepID=UPI003F76C8C5
MERFTISLDERLAREFDEFIRVRGYQNRSEAIRDLLRRHLEEQRLRSGDAPFCTASLSYIYNHHERELAERLTHKQHAHHDLCVSTMHVHLDHEHCLETVVLRGPTAAVRQFAESVMAERGVRHGSLNLVPVDLEAADAAHQHLHTRPKT